MKHPAGDFRARQKNEGPFMHPGMRYDHSPILHDSGAVQQEIEVDDSRASLPAPPPPQVLLDRLHARQEPGRWQSRRNPCRSIVKTGLAPTTHRRSKVDGGKRGNPDSFQRPQSMYRPGDVSKLLSQVRPQPYQRRFRPTPSRVFQSAGTLHVFYRRAP